MWQFLHRVTTYCDGAVVIQIFYIYSIYMHIEKWGTHSVCKMLELCPEHVASEMWQYLSTVYKITHRRHTNKVSLLTQDVWSRNMWPQKEFSLTSFWTQSCEPIMKFTPNIFSNLLVAVLFLSPKETTCCLCCSCLWNTILCMTLGLCPALLHKSSKRKILK